MLGQFIHLISYGILQLAFAQAIMPPHHARCFIYVGIFLLLPWQRTNLNLQLLLAFVVGLIMDAFYDTLGIHAFASVLMVYLKSFLLKTMIATNSYESDIRPILSNMGLKNFSVLILILLFVHHTAVFFLEACNSDLFLLTIRKVVLSTLLTYLSICSIQILTAILASSK
mgnify:CR=1 FL=1